MLKAKLKRTRHAGRRAAIEAELRRPPLPKGGGYLWRIFNRLRRRCGSNGFAMAPIGWPDIDAFVRHSKMPLTPWEIAVIEDLDDLFLKSQADSDEEQEDA